MWLPESNTFIPGEEDAGPGSALGPGQEREEEAGVVGLLPGLGTAAATA